MTKWEYMEIEVMFNENNSTILNELGQQGWEVITPLARANGMTAKVILKRPIQ